ARIVGEAAGVAIELAHVDHVGTDAARSHRQVSLLIVANADGCALAGVRQVLRAHRAHPSISSCRAGAAHRACRHFKTGRRGVATCPGYYTFCTAASYALGEERSCAGPRCRTQTTPLAGLVAYAR